MIPAFDPSGLLPAGEHPCSLSEARDALCFNPHRTELFDHLERFLTDRIRPLQLGCPMFIDGSFVRSKPLPEDVDVVVDATALADDAKLCQLLLLRFAAAHIKAEYRVDFWLKHPSVPNDLVAFFQYAGTKAAAELRIQAIHPKGILRVDL